MQPLELLHHYKKVCKQPWRQMDRLHESQKTKNGWYYLSWGQAHEKIKFWKKPVSTDYPTGEENWEDIRDRAFPSPRTSRNLWSTIAFVLGIWRLYKGIYNFPRDLFGELTKNPTVTFPECLLEMLPEPAIYVRFPEVIGIHDEISLEGCYVTADQIRGSHRLWLFLDSDKGIITIPLASKRSDMIEGFLEKVSDLHDKRWHLVHQVITLVYFICKQNTDIVPTTPPFVPRYSKLQKQMHAALETTEWHVGYREGPEFLKEYLMGNTRGPLGHQRQSPKPHVVRKHTRHIRRMVDGAWQTVKITVRAYSTGRKDGEDLPVVVKPIVHPPAQYT